MKFQFFCGGREDTLNDSGVGFAGKQFYDRFISCIREISGFETRILIAQLLEATLFKRIKTIEMSAPMLDGIADMERRPSSIRTHLQEDARPGESCEIP